MRVLLKDSDNCLFAVEASCIGYDPEERILSVLEMGYEDSFWDRSVPKSVANDLMRELLEKGFLDLSKYKEPENEQENSCFEREKSSSLFGKLFNKNEF